MDPFYKQDIFFFITTIAVVLFTLTWIVIAVYLIKIVKDLKHLTARARTEADLLAEDLSDLRQNLRSQRFGLKALMGFFGHLINKRKKRNSTNL